MLFARPLERWFERDRTRPRTEGVTTPVPRGDATRVAQRDDELPAVDLDGLLATHAALVQRIRTAYGGELGSFETQLAPVIGRFAAFVHLLPVTRDAHFRGTGGCLRCGLEVGFHALQAADAQIFSARGTVQARRAAGPRWRAAAFAMGLCSEVHRPVFGAVVCAEHGAAWHPLLMPLSEWLQQGRRDRYRIQWSDTSTPQRAATLAVLPQLLGAAFLAFLAEPDRTILDHLVAALAAPAGAEQNALGAIVEQTLSRVVARDLRCAGTLRPDRPAACAVEQGTLDDLLPPDSTATSNPRATATSPGDSQADPPAPDTARSQGVEDARHANDPQPVCEPRVPRRDATAPEHGPRRLAIPATLNPVVAEALPALLSSPAGEALAAGIEVSEEGVYVPLGVWEAHGLDTGLVVRALHDARLLVLQGPRKVWRKRCGDAEVLGLMLSPRILA